MSKIHYIIDSRKKAQIEKKQNGKTSVVIDDVVRIEENRVTKLDYSGFINASESKGRKYKLDEWITYIKYIVALLLILTIYIVLGISKDCGILTSGYIDNLVGIVALLFGITSIPKVKEFLGKKVTGRSKHNKLWYVLIMLFLPFFIILLLDLFSLPSSISNICGIIGLIICILTW